MDEIASFGEWSQERRNQLRLSRLTILGVGGMGKTRLGIKVATAQLSNFTDAHQGDLAKAERFHRMALAQRSRVGLEGGIAFSLRDLGEVAYLNGDSEKAQDYFEQSIATANKINMPHTANESLWG